MKYEDFEKHLVKMTKDPAAYGIKECVLCGREHITIVGVCFPEKKLAERLQTPKGKTRTVFYGLCEECASKGQEAADQIEGQLLKDLDEGQSINLLQ